MSVYEQMLERYASGELPWHDALPPPEVIDFVKHRSPGKALDLGCGPGRTAIYLATLGWAVDGVDFIPQAIEMAEEAAQAAQVTVRFHLASVTDLSFLTPPYDLAVDIGCCHALTQPQLQAYHAHLVRLLRPGGDFLLFARLAESTGAENENGPSGIDEAVLQSIFAVGFKRPRADYGLTQLSDGSAWRSGWFYFTRGDSWSASQPVSLSAKN